MPPARAAQLPAAPCGGTIVLPLNLVATTLNCVSGICSWPHAGRCTKTLLQPAAPGEGGDGGMLTGGGGKIPAPCDSASEGDTFKASASCRDGDGATREREPAPRDTFVLVAVPASHPCIVLLLRVVPGERFSSAATLAA